MVEEEGRWEEGNVQTDAGRCEHLDIVWALDSLFDLTR